MDCNITCHACKQPMTFAIPIERMEMGQTGTIRCKCGQTVTVEKRSN